MMTTYVAPLRLQRSVATFCHGWSGSGEVRSGSLWGSASRKQTLHCQTKSLIWREIPGHHTDMLALVSVVQLLQGLHLHRRGHNDSSVVEEQLFSDCELSQCQQVGLRSLCQFVSGQLLLQYWIRVEQIGSEY